jgi:hypothetical protein
MTLHVLGAVVVLALLQSSDCGGDHQSTPDIKQRAQQDALAEQSNAQVGMPDVTNFTEKRLMRMLYELRDKEISTFTYIVDMQGGLHYMCASIGYGLPYGTQFTNPEKVVQNYSQSFGALPQPEPNGLFMPPMAEGTWVICGTKNDIKPVYVEPRVIVSPFKLKSVGEY